MKSIWLPLVLLAFAPPVLSGSGTVITFDEAVSGETVFGFDGDNDGIDDAVFSTTDPAGFNTVGPGPNQIYIDEPGLEGTTTITPDLLVEFPFGAANGFSFGFAVNVGAETPNLSVTFEVFDASDNLLASTTEIADFSDLGGGTLSNFPEAQVQVSFAGTASYATFDFDDTDASRYIIDNFAGTFGSGERPTPGAISVPMLSPWSLAVLIIMLTIMAGSVLVRGRS